MCSFSQDEQQHHDELGLASSTHMPASQPEVAADADAEFPSLMGGQGGGSKRMSKRHASLRNVDKSTTREADDAPTVEGRPSFGAHHWACSCCGFFNRPQNKVCGGPNPRYGCKAPPGGAPPRFVKVKTRYCARWQKEGLADGQPCSHKMCTFAHGPSELGQEQKAPRVGGGVGGGARGSGGGEKEEHAAKISTSGNCLQSRNKGSGGGGVRVPPPSTDTRTSRSSPTVKSSLSYSSSLKLGRDGFAPCSKDAKDVSAKSYAPLHPSSGPPRSQRVSAKPYTPPQRRLVVASPYTYVPPSRRSNSAAESANEGKGCDSQRIFSVKAGGGAGGGGGGGGGDASRCGDNEGFDPRGEFKCERASCDFRTNTFIAVRQHEVRRCCFHPQAEYCAICDKHVNRGQMTDHLGGKKHRAAATREGLGQ